MRVRSKKNNTYRSICNDCHNARQRQKYKPKKKDTLDKLKYRKKYSVLIDQFLAVDGQDEDDLSKYTIRSSKSPRWRCECGEIFEASVGNRTRSFDKTGVPSKCRICLGREVKTGVNSLADKYPFLIQEWDFSRNKLDPEEVYGGGHTKYHWKCNHGHTWKASIQHRISSEAGCPECNLDESAWEHGSYRCKICGYDSYNKTSLATHLSLSHDKMSLQFYEKVFILKEDIPLCKYKGCTNEPTYDAGKEQYREYCANHANEGRKITEQQFLQDVHKILKSQNQKIITNYENYETRRTPLEIECLDCGYKYRRTLETIQNNSGTCIRCRPKGVSLKEIELAKFIKSSTKHEVIQNDHSALQGRQELDIYIPDLKIAFEFNGLYWHSELYKDKDYHRRKTDECLELGIRLVHIWEDDWDSKRDIVKSMILHSLGKSDRIYGRKCEFVQIDTKERKKFFEENHLRGDVGSRHAFGLKYNGELIACMSFRKSIQYSQSHVIEIARFANKLNFCVIGGFSKILKHAIEGMDSQYSKIITYIDLDHGHSEDNVYSCNGFSYVKDTVLDYSYTDGFNRYSRWQFQATPDKSEKELTEEAGVYKIYGTGNKLYELILK